MIKALIFDFDGTIVDTESPWFDIVTQLYHSYGQDLPLPEYLRCVGTKGDEFDVYQRLQDLVGRPLDRAALKVDLTAQHAELMKTVALRSGVLTIIRAAHGRGIPLGIASSSPAEWVWSFLERFDLGNYFQSVVTADDVTKVKPDPELFVKARTSLGCQPEEALVFEDSSYGLSAATAAGLPCVIVYNRLTVHMDFAGAARVYGDFSDFSLDDIL